MLTFFQTEDNEPEIMILQNADPSQPDQGTRFIIKNIEHAALAAQLATNFGNDEFATPEPFDELLFLAAHHDHGWQSLDEDPPVNDKDGLPFNLVDTPIEHIILTSKASPDFNEKHSPFCGLISSMHTYGLYNGRYGLSDAINMDWVPESSRADVDLMLAGETERQSRLKKELENSSLNDEELIFTAYKFLQFVDACALYFNIVSINTTAVNEQYSRFTLHGFPPPSVLVTSRTAYASVAVPWRIMSGKPTLCAKALDVCIGL